MVGMEELGYIAGKITNRLGQPVVDARVRIVEGSAPFPEIVALTDDNGEYELEGISQGTYEVEVTKEGFNTQSKSVEVRPKEKAPLNFVLSDQS